MFWVATALLAAAASPPCNGTNKQKAMYLNYDLEPSLQDSPATDISVDHIWNSTAALRRYGHNGVYAAQPIHTKDVSGYFGSQVTSSGGALLFSIWDEGVKRTDEEVTACLKAGGPNVTWCTHKHAFPLSDSCRRHCLDCGLHPGWHNTTGTQCSLPLDVAEGTRVRFRLHRTANASTLIDPTGFGLTYSGSEWELTAAVDSAAPMVLGRMFWQA